MKVLANLLYIRFRLVEYFIMVEDEILANHGVIEEGILQAQFEDDEGILWLLHPNQFRTYRLTP